jgi:threonine/homoserine/homoserine lactone efflux protein
VTPGVFLTLTATVAVAALTPGPATAASSLGEFFMIVKLLGAAYLAWEGVTLWRARPRPLVLGPTGHEGQFRRNYGAGLLLMFGHVQAMLFYAALMLVAAALVATRV